MNKWVSSIFLVCLSCGQGPPSRSVMRTGQVAIGHISISHHENTGPVVLYSTTTRFRLWGKYRNRAYNVRKAAQQLDGTVIPAYGTFSFNHTVGPRVKTRGWRKALAIVDGELQESYGGGVCQVASTLFSSALYSGLDFPEYWSHSRYMTYLDPGLDATVSDMGKDLRIMNTFPFPVTIRASTAQDLLTISIEAEHRPYEVSVVMTESSREDMGTVFRRNRSLEPGERKVEEQGTDKVSLTRTVRYRPLINGVLEHTWTLHIRYRGSPRVIHFN